MGPRTARAKKESKTILIEKNMLTKNDVETPVDLALVEKNSSEKDKQDGKSVEIKKSTKKRAKKPQKDTEKSLTEITAERDVCTENIADLQIPEKPNEAVRQLKKGNGLKIGKNSKKTVEGITVENKPKIKALKKNNLEKPELNEIMDIENDKGLAKLTNRRGRNAQQKNVIVKEDSPIVSDNAGKVEEMQVSKGNSRKTSKKGAAVKSGHAQLMNVDLDEPVAIEIQPKLKPRSRGRKAQMKEEILNDPVTIPMDVGFEEDVKTHEAEMTVSKKKGKKTKAVSATKKGTAMESSQNVLDTIEVMKPNTNSKERKVRKHVDAPAYISAESASTSDNLVDREGPHNKISQENVQGRKPHKQDIGLELNINNKITEDTPAKIETILESDDLPVNTQAQPKHAARGKRSAPKKTHGMQSDDEGSQDKEEPPNKKSKPEGKKPLKNKAITTYEDINFSNTSKNPQGQPWNLKICSWNVDGIRAWLNKGGLDYIKHEKPDILCLQEVKCSQDKLPGEAVAIPGYHPYWLCSDDKDGYAGVGIYTTKMAINVQYGLQNEDLDGEGRIITAEYEQFFLICTYVPNAGRKLVTLPKRLKWNELFHHYVKKLDEKKPVIICGDMNVAHNEIDLANPKTNKKNAGFTAEERAGMTTLLNDGFVDTFRHLYPDQTGAYTFWTYMMNSRAKNVGWRLDYMLLSERLLPTLCDNVIRSQVFGSDHCPIALFLHLSSVPKIPPES